MLFHCYYSCNVLRSTDYGLLRRYINFYYLILFLVFAYLLRICANLPSCSRARSSKTLATAVWLQLLNLDHHEPATRPPEGEGGGGAELISSRLACGGPSQGDTLYVIAHPQPAGPLDRWTICPGPSPASDGRYSVPDDSWATFGATVEKPTP